MKDPKTVQLMSVRLSFFQKRAQTFLLTIKHSKIVEQKDLNLIWSPKDMGNSILFSSCCTEYRIQFCFYCSKYEIGAVALVLLVFVFVVLVAFRCIAHSTAGQWS